VRFAGGGLVYRLRPGPLDGAIPSSVRAAPAPGRRARRVAVQLGGSTMIQIIATLTCFVGGLLVGGWWAHYRQDKTWSVGQEVDWWLNLITKGRI